MNSYIQKILKTINELDSNDKESLLYHALSYLNTPMIMDLIEKAEQEGLTYEYKNLRDEYNCLISNILSNPKFNQIVWRDIGLEIIKILILSTKFNYEKCDYIYIRQGQLTVLCLKNISLTADQNSKGVSIMINLDLIPIWLYETNITKKNSFTNKIFNFGKIILIPVSIIIAGYLIKNKKSLNFFI